MVLANVSTLANCADLSAVKTLLWLLPKLDLVKLCNRVNLAHKQPFQEVKCVLFEYSYTTPWYVAQGNQSVIDVMPNGRTVHSALKRESFRNLLKDFLGLPAAVSLYDRQKICPGNCPDFHRKQLIIYIKPWTFGRPPTPVSAEGYTYDAETLDPEEDEYADMPPLIPASKIF